MIPFGLTAGDGSPLGSLLNDLERLGVNTIRQSLRPDAPALPVVEEFVGRPLRPLFLFPRLTDANDQVLWLMRTVVEQLGASGADIGIGNESSINGETIDEAVTAVEYAQDIATQVGFEGAIYASAIPNLDPDRDFGWMRRFWPRLSKEVVRDFHRYPEIRFPWSLDDRHPWHQFHTLNEECDAVLHEAAGSPLAITEFAHSTVVRELTLGDDRITNAEAADYLTADLVLYATYGITPFVYQLNAGPGDSWGECQGIRHVSDSRWLPQSACFARARHLLGENMADRKWSLVKQVPVSGGMVLANPDGTIRSLNPASNDPPYGPYHWESRPAGADGGYERCTLGGGRATYNPSGHEPVVFGFTESVPNTQGYSGLTEDQV